MPRRNWEREAEKSAAIVKQQRAGLDAVRMAVAQAELGIDITGRILGILDLVDQLTLPVGGEEK
jgi:hypothetical protein